MRLACPNCGARYDVDDAAVPAAGRAVQCSACDHSWFQRPATAGPAPAAAEAKAHPAASGTAEPAPPQRDAPLPDAPTAIETADPPRARPTDPAVLQILREEAAREMEQRRREATRARLRDPAPSPETAAESTAPRRALLPDIDEVSPTLHPSGSQDRGATVVHRAPPARSRRGFVAGLTLSLALSALAAAAYIWSAELADAVPALSGPLSDYVAAVDDLRLAIHSATR